MGKEDTKIRRKIRLIEKHVAELRLLTPTDTGLADAVGHARGIEVALAAVRHRWESLVVEIVPVQEPDPEAPPGRRVPKPSVEGVDFKLEPQFKTVRTFNTPALLTEISTVTDTGPTDALMNAIEAGAIRLSWQWLKTKKYMADIGATLTILDEPVSDSDGLDSPMVGEDRQPNGVKRVPLNQSVSDGR